MYVSIFEEPEEMLKSPLPIVKYRPYCIHLQLEEQTLYRFRICFFQAYIQFKRFDKY